MTNDELKENWQKYAVEVDGERVALKDRFAICYGWCEQWGGLGFDIGGEQPGVNYIFIVEDDKLVSVNPADHNERDVLGPLVLLEAA